MTYLDKDDQDMDINELGDFYDDGVYDELYQTDSFGERVDSGTDDDMVVIDEEEMIVEAKPRTPQTNRVEEGFGEAISPDSNPHINDQLEDDGLSNEAEADYSEKDSGGIISKARQKLDEWTDKDNRE